MNPAATSTVPDFEAIKTLLENHLVIRPLRRDRHHTAARRRDALRSHRRRGCSRRRRGSRQRERLARRRTRRGPTSSHPTTSPRASRARRLAPPPRADRYRGKGRRRGTPLRRVGVRRRDVVFGVMFTPDQERAAAEVVRGAPAGGSIGLAEQLDARELRWADVPDRRALRPAAVGHPLTTGVGTPRRGLHPAARRRRADG